MRVLTFVYLVAFSAACDGCGNAGAEAKPRGTLIKPDHLLENDQDEGKEPPRKINRRNMPVDYADPPAPPRDGAVYVHAYEEARQSINSDNAKKVLDELERQINLERKALRR